ncbi:MAG: hypothetical protein ACRDVP_11390 [Acidimicrobiales bacterium]
MALLSGSGGDDLVHGHARIDERPCLPAADDRQSVGIKEADLDE